ncbi:MAG: hypothetical protein LBN38_03365 [Verrucomicrobiota bacterium]|jgi:hypothetical protein|nr:hypothetical protein [Verrucomicrobiota bacterium]
MAGGQWSKAELVEAFQILPFSVEIHQADQVAILYQRPEEGDRWFIGIVSNGVSPDGSCAVSPLIQLGERQETVENRSYWLSSTSFPFVCLELVQSKMVQLFSYKIFPFYCASAEQVDIFERHRLVREGIINGVPWMLARPNPFDVEKMMLAKFWPDFKFRQSDLPDMSVASLEGICLADSPNGPEVHGILNGKYAFVLSIQMEIPRLIYPGHLSLELLEPDGGSGSGAVEDGVTNRALIKSKGLE